MSSANRKEQRVSFQNIPSSKSHRHQTSDSGVGSDFSSSPTPQEYFDLERNHIKLKEEFLATRNKLKEAEAQLQEANARLSAMENTVEVLENDNKALDREKRNLRTEVEALRDDIRKSRSSPPRESTKMSGALPPHPSSPKEHKEHKEHKSSRRSESKHHRSESKHRRSESKPRKNTEEKELEKRVKQDKERLRGRFDHKDDKSVASSTSSGRSKQSGSYMEPLGPVAPRPAPAVEQAGRSRHSHHNSIRPAVYTTTTIAEPAYGALPHSPAYQDYDADYYPDATSQYVQEDGGYHFHPLPVDPPRGRSHR